MKTTHKAISTKFANFANIAKTILIVSLVGLALIFSVMIFITEGTEVNAQLGVEDNPWFLDKTTEGANVMGDGVVPGGPGFIMVSAFDFKPYYQEMNNTWEYLGPQVHNPHESSFSYLVAGLTLPHGARITQLTLYYLDSSVTRNLERYLTENDGSGGSFTMSSLLTDGTAVAYRTLSTTAIDNPTVDNQNNSYSLYLTLPPDPDSVVRAVNVRVDYVYTSYTPLIAK